MILLGLGSNVGDRDGYLRQARQALEAAGVQVLAQSPVIETPALLLPGSTAAWDMPFMNQVIHVHTVLSPEALLACVKQIEAALGRQDRGRWAPREIDIDILSYHAELRDSPLLTLPHPGLAERRFVLEPLAEIAPEWRHPILGKTARELMA